MILKAIFDTHHTPARPIHNPKIAFLCERVRLRLVVQQPMWWQQQNGVCVWEFTVSDPQGHSYNGAELNVSINFGSD